MQLVPGTVVRDGIRLVRRLAAGSMGSLWVADHAGLSTQVAVKFMHRDLVADHEDMALARFRREAQAAARLKSPHVVQIFDAGVMPSGTPFIVMELLEGEDLGARIARTGPLSLPDACDVVAQVARALERAHELGIVHRDIKPANIFLVAGQGAIYAKVLDFGVAKLDRWGGSGTLTHPEELVGTPAYLSREAILAEPTDHRLDLWALAVVAYEALTGKLPFTGASMALTCVAICEGTFTAATALRPDLPPAIDAFFARAFHDDVAQRFGSARELARALLLTTTGAEEDVHRIDRALLETGRFRLPSSAGLDRPGERDPEPHVGDAAGRKGRRRRATAGAVIAGAALALGIAVAMVAYDDRDPAGDAPAGDVPAESPSEPLASPSIAPPADSESAPSVRASPSASVEVETADSERGDAGGDKDPPPAALPRPAPERTVDPPHTGPPSVREAEKQLGF